MKTLSLLALGLTTLFMNCGSTKLSGTYLGQDDAFYVENMTFTSSKTVELESGMATVEGTYTIDEDKVKITVGGQIHIFTIIDNGCLDGGGMLGTFCKE